MASSPPGFSLIELLVAMTLLAVFGSAMFSVFAGNVSTIRRQQQVVMTKEQADAAFDMMTKEIAMAGSRPRPESYSSASCAAPPAAVTPVNIPCALTSIAGFEALPNTTTSAITFQYDSLTGPTAGCPTDTDEKVAYSWDGTSGHPITRAANDGTAIPLLPSVSSFSLQYYDGGGSLLSNPSDATSRAAIRRILVSMTVSVASANPRIAGTVQAIRTAIVALRSPAC